VVIEREEVLCVEADGVEAVIVLDAEEVMALSQLNSRRSRRCWRRWTTWPG
jgi:hypothetical protein